MKIILFANTDWFLYNFRLSLIKQLAKEGHQLLLVSAGGDYAQKMASEGFRHHAVRLSQRGINPFTELRSILELIKLYQSEKPDLVHHFTIKPVLYGSFAAKIADLPKIINSITGLGYVFISNELKAKVIRFFVKLFYRPTLKRTTVIFENQDDRSLFIDLGLVSADQTTYIPGSGVDTQVFTPCEEPSLPVTVLLPARLLYSKGISEFVGAARILKDKGVQARFILAGDIYPGNPHYIPESVVDGWVREGTIEWLGWQSDMAKAFRTAHIICLPSYREGLPKALVEAAACGKPIVTTDVPGCREIVQDGENGLIVRSRNTEDLADALEKLISNPAMRKVLGEKGRQLVENGFSIYHVNNATLQLYKSA